MEVLSQIYQSYVIDNVASFFKVLSWSPISDQHWFLSPEQHAHEFIFMNAIYIMLIVLGRYLMNEEGPKKSKTHVRVQSQKQQGNSIVVNLVAIVLIGNVIMNLIFKVLRGWRVVFFMFQPCHVVSCVYAYCLLTKNYNNGSRVFKVSIYYIFVTVAALAAPDTTDLTLPLEVENFFIQHYALLIAPFIIHIYKYSIGFQWSYALISAGIIGITHFAVFDCLCFISGINLNYMLFPPPLPISSELVQESYRLMIASSLLFVSWFLGYLVILISNVIKPFIFKNLSSINTSNKEL